jgi:phosphonopyruvate decarboxylase
MIEAEQFIQAARRYDFSLYTGVPCSYLTAFINPVINSDELRYVGAANEGDAIAIAAGAELAGRRSVVMLQNSGLGNTVNPLTSLTHIFRIPLLLIVTLRGEPGGAPDEPQHELMGQITTRLLELMEIPWRYFPRDQADIEPVVSEAVAAMDKTGRPYALVMRKGSVAKTALRAATDPRDIMPAIVSRRTAVARRGEMLRAIQGVLCADDLVVATTGYTGRELYACGDRPNQLYMVGSMGCALSLGLGLAIARPDRRILVLDGDGAALMRLGALATAGFERPANLVHVLLDNGVHESTGGQQTVSRSIDFCALAAACGYRQVTEAANAGDLAAKVRAATGQLSFIHVPILPGGPPLPRPEISPPEVAARFRRHIAAADAVANVE